LLLPVLVVVIRAGALPSRCLDSYFSKKLDSRYFAHCQDVRFEKSHPLRSDYIKARQTSKFFYFRKEYQKYFTSTKSFRCSFPRSAFLTLDHDPMKNKTVRRNKVDAAPIIKTASLFSTKLSYEIVGIGKGFNVGGGVGELEGTGEGFKVGCRSGGNG
jgi:hypothetical protein